MPYSSGSFDLIYALSVFTHLPEHLQLPWIAELHRVLEPGGRLILSTHGPHYRSDLTSAERERFESGQLVVKGDLPATNAFGAYHPERYVRELLAGRFTIVEYLPQGATGNPDQDLYTLRRL